MKKQYIKPAIELVACEPMHLMMGSTEIGINFEEEPLDAEQAQSKTIDSIWDE